MTTGPEHYRAASRFLEAAGKVAEDVVAGRKPQSTMTTVPHLVALAAAHAELAHTAALLESGPISTGWASAIGRADSPRFP